MDIIPILNIAIPAVLALVGMQKAPDNLVPVKEQPETPKERMTVVGAVVVLLLAGEAIRTGNPATIDPVQVTAAAAVLWALWPRAAQMADSAIKAIKSK